MIPRIDKAGKLRDERARLMSDATVVNGAMVYECDIRRIAWIDRELAKLARRKAYGRMYRETMYDLNGHHGPA